MARIIPDDWEALAVTGAAARERDTLALMARQLGEDYTVYHGVHWTRLEHGHAIFGEADFIIVNRSGNLLVIEQKNGLLEETADGLLKHYPERRKLVPLQMARTRDALLSRLKSRPGCQDLRVEILLYCPDYHVQHPHTAGLLPERIVDARRAGQLCGVIRSLLPAGDDHSTVQQVHRFLQDLVELEPDVSALMGQASALVTRVAGGLAHWARCIEMHPFRLRVRGTAGSGKTQLALAEYRASVEAGRRPLYVCFNRPLADHFQQIVPAGGRVASFHQFCDQRLRARGTAFDYRQPDAFDRLVQQAASLLVEPAELFDALIIDEGQDFTESWATLVLRHARPDARLLWLEDPLQNVYDRPPVALPDWVTLRAGTNFRSPPSVVRVLNHLLELGGLPRDIAAASPLAGDEVEFLTYANAAELLARTKDALRLCWSAGFRAQDTVLLSYHGRQRSTVLRFDKLGQERLRSFTGSYDLFGSPIYSEGEVLSDSVLRFKGQSAPAVVLTEIDFAALDRVALVRLFVGITRARLKLVLVLAEHTAQLLTRLQAP